MDDKIERRVVMQALTAAVLFGDNAGAAAADSDDGLITTPVGNLLAMDPEASDLLRDAHELSQTVKQKYVGYVMNMYDLRNVERKEAGDGNEGA